MTRAVRVTPRMVEALRAVVEHLERHGYPPSIAEVGDALEPPVSPARAQQLLDALVLARLLERDEGVARGLRLVGGNPPIDSSTTGPGD